MRVRRAAALFVRDRWSRSLATIVVAGPRRGAESRERIVDYRSEVTIETDGTIEVHETIVYDFGVVPRHGIFRVIPVRTERVAERRLRPRLPARRRVGDRVGGHARQYTVEEDGDNERIKIGDPDRDDQRRAHLRHRVPRPRRDERVRATTTSCTGTWSATTGRCRSSQATAVVHAPADITQVACFTRRLRCRRWRATPRRARGADGASSPRRR